MKSAMISVWLMLGLGGLIFHFGPGKELERYDVVGSTVDQARKKVSLEDWSGAIESLDKALEAVPEERTDLDYEIRLEKAKAQMFDSQLPEARMGLEALLDEVLADDKADPELVDETRKSLANAQYYVTWLMRLEGSPREEWEPEIEASRQNYRLLAEKAEASGTAKQVEEAREDVESAVRLARLDLSELQALPLPCQCKGCKSCDCKGKKPGKKKGKKPAKGASDQLPPEHIGS